MIKSFSQKSTWHPSIIYITVSFILAHAQRKSRKHIFLLKIFRFLCLDLITLDTNVLEWVERLLKHLLIKALLQIPFKSQTNMSGWVTGCKTETLGLISINLSVICDFKYDMSYDLCISVKNITVLNFYVFMSLCID